MARIFDACCSLDHSRVNATYNLALNTMDPHGSTGERRWGGDAEDGRDPLIGQTLSHYRLVARLGGGGMGVVYKADDTRLRRPVALKFVSEELSRDPEALSRFAREAQTASALNHPNICTIYDIGEQAERSFIVMEYLEGVTLKDRLAAGSMSLDTVLHVGMQMADALDAAHTAGIIHRDIKPANVFIGSRDHVKVLDFGLAKMWCPPASDMTTIAGTRQGVVMGTVAYMAPEQASGETVDHRADIWSLGVVLYEMVTGTRPVPGVRLRVEGTPELERIISKCLDPDRELRYQHAAELRIDLDQLKRGPAAALAQHSPLARRRPLWLSIGAAAVIAAAVAWTIYGRRPATLTDKDTIVLGDFTNTTGDPVFDDTLRQGLAVQLQQSPFLSLVSDERIGRTLAADATAAGYAADSRDCAGCLRPNGKRRGARWIDRQPRQSVHPRLAREELLHRRHSRRRAGASGAQGRCPRLPESDGHPGPRTAGRIGRHHREILQTAPGSDDGVFGRFESLHHRKAGVRVIRPRAGPTAVRACHRDRPGLRDRPCAARDLLQQ